MLSLMISPPVHPQLQFVSHLPVYVLGEQLIAQLLRGIPDEQWLFQYGRVPMSFILTDHVYKVRICCIETETNDSSITVFFSD